MAVICFFLTFAAMNEFSLLISVYSKENAGHLKTCFDSIFQQTLQPTEIVLVEDGPLSPELYRTIAEEEKRFPCFKRVKLETNQGLGTALNCGMQACTYDLIARMDTDDICLPHRFEVQTAYFQSHPEVDVLGAWITEFDDVPTNVVSVRSLPEEHDDIFRFGKKRNPINHPVVMFRKQAVLKAGGYQPCMLFEDYYLWARMLTQGFHFHNLQQSLLLFRRSPAMFQRRGGVAYAHYELQFFKKLHKLGYISTFNLVINLMQRYIVRMLPNRLRSLVYRHLLRSVPQK